MNTLTQSHPEKVDALKDYLAVATFYEEIRGLSRLRSTARAQSQGRELFNVSSVTCCIA